jgi:hypothetical protein
VYGQEAMLPVEINLQTWRVAGQEALSTEEYAELRMENIDDVHESVGRNREGQVEGGQDL